LRASPAARGEGPAAACGTALRAWLLAAYIPLSCAQAPSAPSPSAAPPPVTAKHLYLQTEAAFILHHDVLQAKHGFRRVLQLDPRYAPAWFNLAVLAEAERQWGSAEEDFKRYLALLPQGPDAERARQQLKMLPQYAAGGLSPATATAGEYDAAIQRARQFLAAGYFREAVAEAGRAQDVDPSRWEAYAVASLCMAKQDKVAQARQFAAQAIERAPEAKREQLRTALALNSAALSH